MKRRNPNNTESGPSRKKVKVSQPESSLLVSRISLDSEEEGDDVVNTQRTHKKSLSVLVEDDDIFSQKF